jgi:hypothetical protein
MLVAPISDTEVYKIGTGEAATRGLLLHILVVLVHSFTTIFCSCVWACRELGVRDDWSKQGGRMWTGVHEEGARLPLMSSQIAPRVSTRKQTSLITKSFYSFQVTIDRFALLDAASHS